MKPVAAFSAKSAQTPPELERILKLLRHENRWFFYRTVCCGALWCLAIIVLLLWTVASFSQQLIGLFPLFLSLLLLVTGAILIGTQQSRAVEELMTQQDSRAVAPLLDALAMSYGAKTQAIQSLLILLLPQMTFADASLLNRSQSGILWDALEIDNPNDALDYPFAILAGWERIGNRETVRRLHKLIQRGAITPRQLKIKEAAEQCLVGLEARLAQEQVSGTLLRAAEPIYHPAELLHSIRISPDADAETLLHSANHPVE